MGKDVVGLGGCDVGETGVIGGGFCSGLTGGEVRSEPVLGKDVTGCDDCDAKGGA